MTVVALDKNRTAIFSPIPLEEPAMTEIEALGAPAYLIVPNRAHRLDIRPFAARYPSAKVLAPKGGKAKVEEAVPVDTTSPKLGDRAEVIHVAGMDEVELAMLVRHEGGTSLIVNDVIGNVAHPQGLGARIMARLTGFGPRPSLPRIEKHLFLKDKAAFADQLEAWAATPGLRRIIPSHGDIIDQPATVLRRLAASLR